MSLTARVEARMGDLDLALSLDVGSGESVVLLGPNGAGKTSFLRALAGLLRVDRGSVTLDGRVLEDTRSGVRVEPEERGVGFVFQEPLLFPSLSVAGNVAFGLRARGVSRREAHAAAVRWLEHVGMAACAGARPASLSGGQAQRVALARALCSHPRLLLLDEPLSAVDASARPELRRMLRAKLAEFEGTRIVVTHDPVEAMVLADRIAVLEDGRVSQEGTPEELRARPRSRYVADLVGVNLLRGRGRGEAVDLEAGGRLVVPGAGRGQIFVTVHPRAVALFRERPHGTPRNVWQGRIAALDVEGERVRVVIDGEIGLVAEITPAAVADLGLDVGLGIWAAVKATEIGVYPA